MEGRNISTGTRQGSINDFTYRNELENIYNHILHIIATCEVITFIIMLYFEASMTNNN